MKYFLGMAVAVSFFLIIQGNSFIAAENQSKVFDFLPKANLLKSGIVQKYYIHFDQEDEYNDVTTVVEYRSYQSVDQKILTSNTYDVAFDMIRSSKFEIIGNGLKTVSEIKYFPVPVPVKRNTVEYTILKPNYLDFQKEEQTHEISDGKKRWSRNQISLRDTTILDYPGMVVEGIYVTTSDNDSILKEEPYREIYLEGLGLFAAYFFSEEGTYHRELVEQIHLKDFFKLAAHETKRIGAIDIDKDEIISKDEDFKPCGDYIFEYYNGNSHDVFIGGKYAFKKTVFPLIDSALLFQESGYLTFRFVVNCKGQIGRLVTEMVDENFNETVFNKKTVDHLAGILLDLDSWKVNKFRGKEMDAYTYITFKFKDGKIIEILP